MKYSLKRATNPKNYISNPAEYFTTKQNHKLHISYLKQVQSSFKAEHGHAAAGEVACIEIIKP
jgi:hypothetical protein